MRSKIDAIQQNLPFRGVVEPCHQLYDRGLALAVLANQRQTLRWMQLKIYAIEDRRHPAESALPWGRRAVSSTLRSWSCPRRSRQSAPDAPLDATENLCDRRSTPSSRICPSVGS